jgi:hypothetical protein
MAMNVAALIQMIKYILSNIVIIYGLVYRLWCFNETFYLIIRIDSLPGDFTVNMLLAGQRRPTSYASRPAEVQKLLQVMAK